MATAKILVVDDDKEFRDLLSEILRKERYEVRTAESVEAAMEELERGSYDIVTVDMKYKIGSTEDIAGEELLIHLKANYEGIRCIIISGSPEVEVSRTQAAYFAIKYGAPFVEKHRFNRTEFKRLVKELLEEDATVRSGGGESIKAKSLRKQLDEHQSNLNKLEEQKATFGKGEEPLRLLNQIEAEEREIARLKAELREFEKEPDSADSE